MLSFKWKKVEQNLIVFRILFKEYPRVFSRKRLKNYENLLFLRIPSAEMEIFLTIVS